MKYLILLLLSFCLNAQTVFTETFSTLQIDSATTNLFALYRLDPANYTITNDYSVNTNTLTNNNTVGDSTISHTLYPSGQAVYFNGTNQYLSIAGASAGDFNRTGGDWSIIAKIKVHNTTGNKAIASKYQNDTNRWFFRTIHSSNSLYAYEYSTGAGNVINDSRNFTSTTPYADTTWHIVAINVDKDTKIDFWVDNTVATEVQSSAGDVDNTGDFQIGREGASGNYFKYYIAEVAFFDSYLSAADYRKAVFLSPNWISTTGNVIRQKDGDGFELFQTAWSDTLCVPLSDAALGNNQEWVLTSSNIDNVTAWIGSRSSAKSVKKSITGGVSFVSNTTYFGDGFSLEGDSLVVVFPADTASIDNIVFKKTQHHLKSPANRGWLGW